MQRTSDDKCVDRSIESLEDPVPIHIHRDGEVMFGITTTSFLSPPLVLPEILEKPGTPMFMVNQVHGNVIVPTEQIRGASPSADALYSMNHNELLIIKVADCGGIVLYDTRSEFVAAIHSGWRGTSQNIVERVMSTARSIGIQPASMKAWISPLADGRCYEVGEDVQAHLASFCTPTQSPGKWLFDNRAAITTQLLAGGLVPSNITVSSSCTIHNKGFHSYRRDGANAGRNYVFVARFRL